VVLECEERREGLASLNSFISSRRVSDSFTLATVEASVSGRATTGYTSFLCSAVIADRVVLRAFSNLCWAVYNLERFSAIEGFAASGFENLENN
jgi:hypothetical protein